MQKGAWSKSRRASHARNPITPSSCPTITIALATPLIDHLPNGAYYNVSDRSIIEETASVPTTNVSPERDFAVLNRYLRVKPNAQLIALEAMTLHTHNKTSLLMAQLYVKERSCFKLLESLHLHSKKNSKGEKKR